MSMFRRSNPRRGFSLRAPRRGPILLGGRGAIFSLELQSPSYASKESISRSNTARDGSPPYHVLAREASIENFMAQDLKETRQVI